MREDSGRNVTVVYFQRKPRVVGNYSVEYIFEDVRNRLKGRVDSRVVISRYESKGLLPRIYNCIEAFFKSGRINHITGDVNYLALFLRKDRTINTILDCVHLEASKGIKYRILKLFWLTLPEKHSRYITAISESTKQEILKHHMCDPGKIKVIPVAISPAFKYQFKDFDSGRPRILQVGTAPNKNIPRLIAALKGIPCILNIVGKPNDEYTQLCIDNGIEYIYESGLSEQEMIRRYEMADIISLISTYEGFGMPILEGQAVGRPVITSNIFSMPEVAGDSAVTVDPFDVAAIRNAFERIIGDREFRDGRIAAGLENVKRFDADLIADQYYQLYNNILISNQ